MLLVATVVGPNVRCTLVDVMNPDMATKVMAEVTISDQRILILLVLTRCRCHTRLGIRSSWRRML